MNYGNLIYTIVLVFSIFRNISDFLECMFVFLVCFVLQVVIFEQKYWKHFFLEYLM